MKPGPATSADAIQGDSRLSTIRPAISRGEERSSRASDIATADA
jgi:hypothetical protein